jgi:hypothetical protein
MSDLDSPDLTSVILGQGVHYIESSVYSLEHKSFMLVTRILTQPGLRTLRFSEVIDFRGDAYDLDENCMASIVGIHKADEHTYVIHTDQREFMIKTLVEPELLFSES